MIEAEMSKPLWQVQEIEGEIAQQIGARRFAAGKQFIISLWYDNNKHTKKEGHQQAQNSFPDVLPSTSRLQRVIGAGPCQHHKHGHDPLAHESDDDIGTYPGGGIFYMPVTKAIKEPG